ncbi:MAG: type I restriction endonuclease subunit R [Clostridia bacterium]|jgi:type I restriction enzyme R subunit|nr:type I restriction endonuclease subunit R [Clostridia bacterium]
MEHSENTRVKIPALVHLTRLGYKYLSLKEIKQYIHENTNIFRKVFCESINKINNKNFSIEETDKIISELEIQLANDDLGKSFYITLINGFDGIKLIDFEDIDNNTFNVVTELTYRNGEDEFRPDIIPLINGIPLSFIEVKKPNNREGILAERNRINARFRNPKFKKFVNLTQLLVFSNNDEYDEESIVPIQGAFYGTSSYSNVFFNCFREEEVGIINYIKPINQTEEEKILIDTNYVTLKGTAEYNTNLDINTPTNRIITSLFTKERFLKILKYGIAYVEKLDKNGIIQIQKHIMRYPQLFATLAIENKLEQGINKGIIWHTQGSGKTALTYFNVKYLTDYFAKQGKIAKFYFIVDRLDLLDQASKEFTARGLKVEKVNSKEEFIKNIQTIGEVGTTGELTITVINIQKFSEESIVKPADYNVDVQRIYFMDEAHRSYNPKGSFLANLMASDRKAIMIALTGTPLIGNGYSSKDVFGDYIHKYYYNRSIADGYTLKLIREGIETSYRSYLEQALKEVEAIKGMAKKEDIYSHHKYVSALVEYIANDFNKTKIRLNDNSIGAMVVCDSSKQARAVFEELNNYENIASALILHDEDDKETRRTEQDDFKKGEIDILVVYNMLLTGFDAPRLKKIYLGRVIKAHNLLQTLTRVNRPYKDYKYGYVVDFADIRAEFDKTNKAYFEELQSELGDEFANYANIFKDKDEIEKDITELKNKLFMFDTENLENFTRQINELPKQELYDIRKSLENYKILYNLIKMYGYEDLTDKIDISKVSRLLSEVSNRINILNLTENINNSESITGLLNMALDKIDFNFRKISESELVIADKFRENLERTRVELERNFDKKDLEFISLYEELKRIFSKKNIEELTSEEMQNSILELEKLRERIKQRNSKDEMLILKYENDIKFMRIHKRIKEANIDNINDIVLNQMLLEIKHKVDEILVKNYKLMDNEAFFYGSITPIIAKTSLAYNVKLTIDQIQFVTNNVLEEYIEERKLVG